MAAKDSAGAELAGNLSASRLALLHLSGCGF